MQLNKMPQDLIMGEMLAQHPELLEVLDRVANRTRQTKRQIEPFQAAALYTLARQYRNEELVRVLEIGTAYGYSAAVIAEALPEAEIITLNPKTHEVIHVRNTLTQYYPNITVLELKSTEYLSSLTSDYRFDLIFVDGDHKRVKADLPFMRHLRLGGLILFHDYSPAGTRRECPPVYEALNEYSDEQGIPFHVKVIDDDDIGMVGFYNIPEPLILDDQKMVVMEAVSKWSTHTSGELLRMAELVSEAAPGMIVEVGVQNGGSLVALAIGDKSRKVLGIDVFGRMPQPMLQDTGRVHVKWENLYWSIGSIADVNRCMVTGGVSPESVTLIQSRIEYYYPDSELLKVGIGVLHIDATLYASTSSALRKLYPLVVPGGVVIVSAYSYWEGIRRAVDEYMRNKPKRSFTTCGTNAYWFKPIPEQD